MLRHSAELVNPFALSLIISWPTRIVLSLSCYRKLLDEWTIVNLSPDHMAGPRAEASHGPLQQEWERYKDKIIDLYLRTSLKDVMSEMEKHGFHAK